MYILKPQDLVRLLKLKGDLLQLEIRFPLTYLSKTLGVDKSNISSFLRGSKPMSDDFFKKVNAHLTILAKEKGITLAKPVDSKSSSLYHAAIDRALAMDFLKLLEDVKKNLDTTIEAYRRYLQNLSEDHRPEVTA
jgi:hypothetical protein